jgi:thioredoxin-related protein
MSFRDFFIIIMVLLILNVFVDVDASTMNVFRMNKSEVSDLAKQNPKLVIILDQLGCGACEVAKEFIKKIDSKDIRYVFVDISRVPFEFAKSHATPTFLFFKNGKYVGQYIGVPRRPALLLQEIKKGLK